MKLQKPCMFVGESGTAKTVTIQKHMQSLPGSSFTSLIMNFSSRTTAADVQIAIEESTEKRTKVTLVACMGLQNVHYCIGLDEEKGAKVYFYREEAAKCQ